jgi:hypothetical protein
MRKRYASVPRVVSAGLLQSGPIAMDHSQSGKQFDDES